MIRRTSRSHAPPGRPSDDPGAPAELIQRKVCRRRRRSRGLGPPLHRAAVRVSPVLHRDCPPRHAPEATWRRRNHAKPTLVCANAPPPRPRFGVPFHALIHFPQSRIMPRDVVSAKPLLHLSARSTLSDLQVFHMIAATRAIRCMKTIFPPLSW